MPKGYWVTFYRSVSDPAALAEYARRGAPAIEAGGGRFLARGVAKQVFEEGLQQRSIVIEFDSVEQAIATYNSPAYEAARRLLIGAAERDLRILEGVEGT